MDISRRRAGEAVWALVILAMLLLSVAPVVGAQEVDLRGKLSYQLGYGYTQQELVENALALEVSFERRLGFDGKVHLDVNGRVAAAGEPSRWELGEAYLDWYTDSMDWRIGRQVISWGTADGFNPTNVINPQAPLSPGALLSAGGLKGTPVLAVQGAYYLPSGASLTGVAVTEFVPAADGRRLLEAIAARIGEQTGGGPLPVEGPGQVPAGQQPEWAVRGDTVLGGHNVYLSYFRGWDDYPAAWVEYEAAPAGPLPGLPVPSRIVATYRRVHKVGLATAGTVGGAGVWTEVGYTVPDAVAGLDGPGALSSNQPYVEAVVGADYTFAGGVTVSGQVIYHGGGSLLSPYKSPADGVQPQTYGLVIARYSPQPGHTLEGVALANLGDGGTIAMGRYAYDITQATKLTVGVAHVVAGPEAGFDQVRDAANMVTAGIEVSF